MKYLCLNRGRLAKSLGVLALSVGMASSTAALARSQDEDASKSAGTRSEGSMTRSGGSEGERRASIGGSIQGTVENLNLARGTVQISTGGDTLTLHALPMQLAKLSPGDNVDLDYDSYKGVLWVSSDMEGGGDSENSKFAHRGKVSGAVSSLDKPNGMITIRGKTYHVHPSQLDDVVPGEFVSLSFAKVGDANWASSIESEGGGG